jgi:hypothetical protein
MRHTEHAKTLTAGAGYCSPVEIQHENATLSLIPTAGGTMTAQYTTSKREQLAQGTATWIAVPGMDGVAAASTYTLPGLATAVRASATTQNGIFEVVQ